jgi:hypothetical protein
MRVCLLALLPGMLSIKGKRQESAVKCLGLTSSHQGLLLGVLISQVHRQEICK